MTSSTSFNYLFLLYFRIRAWWIHLAYIAASMIWMVLFLLAPFLDVWYIPRDVDWNVPLDKVADYFWEGTVTPYILVALLGVGYVSMYYTKINYCVQVYRAYKGKGIKV